MLVYLFKIQFLHTFEIMGYCDLYVAQIKSAGNCITLLSSPPAFSLESFRDSNLFEDIARYVFWTFNESYRRQLIEYLAGFRDVELQKIPKSSL
jgi:hypothetical protein